MLGQQVFIASSNEKKKLAKKIAEELNCIGLNVLPWWDKRAFRPGDYTMERLIQISHLSEACVLIFGSEDELWFRPKKGNKPQMSARDNVLLEYGLFVGQVGIKHAVIVAVEGIKLPSNIDGITIIYYNENESHAKIAAQVNEYFEQLLQDEIEQFKFDDTTLFIGTDWELDIHQLESNHHPKWNSIRLYQGKKGALAWRNVEIDPQYAERTQTNINGQQIANLIGEDELSTIISFGPGLGTVDAELIANLKTEKLKEYVPIDVNRYFLIESAKKVVKSRPNVVCKHAIQCDFDKDTTFVGKIIRKHCPRPRLFLMAGGTFGNSKRSVFSQLRVLYQIMDKGDIFTFDLFCHGEEYEAKKDPMLDKEQWPDAVMNFFSVAIEGLELEENEQSKKNDRVVTKLAENTSGLSKTTHVSVYDSETDIELVSIRRFDYTEIYEAISKAGFEVTKLKQVSIGDLARHVLLAKK